MPSLRMIGKGRVTELIRKCPAKELGNLGKFCNRVAREHNQDILR